MTDKRESDLMLIERYLDGDPDVDTVNEIARRMESDKHFKNLVERERELRLGIEYASLKNAYDELQELEASLPDYSLSERSNAKIYRYAGIAAIIALLIVSGIFLLKKEQQDPADLFAEYFEPASYDFSVRLRNGNSTEDIEVARGAQAYKNGDYTAAIVVFEKMIAESKSPMFLYYLANAQLAEGNFQGAEANLLKFIEISEDYRHEAHWYLSLAYLQQGQTEKAKEQLQHLDAERGDFSGKAAELLKKLE
ncbi:tetratricopeptide repeat protein [Fulvivirgaceae bacterium BMA10]|uniref:Tetratricopeptide repeat protein n=1 Tax=Splendidivirga corallicola TaxID=3051826 RepID=A0ABT8KJY8_9BACT|nr:tetratricopeptide repeat protein [Fulvivirgaceae bacterium BMA10]